MLTPAEEVGLAGLRLASRVQRALDAVPPGEMAALLQEIQELATARHLFYDHEGVTETVRVLPCPITLRQDQVAYSHYIAQTLLQSLKRLPDLYLADPAVREILRLSEPEERWLAETWTPAQREQNPVFARLDVVADYTTAMWKDTLKFLEPNLSGIGGLHLAPGAGRVLADLVVPVLVARDPRIRLQLSADIRELLLQDLLEHLEVTGRPGGQIVLVDPKYEEEGPDDPEALARYYADRHGLTVLHADPSELRLVGEEVYYGDARVDVAYRDYSVLDLLDLADEGVDIAPMRRLFAANRMVSSIAAELDQKACWEVFTDPELARRYFGPEERQLFQRHVLWTRILSDRRTTVPGGQSEELLPFVRRERERLVLKPNRGYGGDGVLLGASVPGPEWDRAIDLALADPDDRWVVQEMSPIPVREFHLLDEAGQVHLEPFYVVMGFAPSRYGLSLVARASQKQVVNVARRGGICGVMVSASAVSG